jgi:hypothetical protein
MGTKTVKFSDLSGELVADASQLGRLVVREHPDYPASITLDVLPDDLGDLKDEGSQFVSLEYYAPGETTAYRLVVRREDFNSLAKANDMDTILDEALRAQHRQQRETAPERPRRPGRPRRIDYASPEHAGEPHRGRVTEAEREYVRTHLAEVNARLRASGLREIDPQDPKMQQRYGLTPSEAA